MKILVVVDSINIEDSSGSKANVALIKNLAEAGFDVLVYHYTLRNIHLAGVRCYAIPEIKFSPLYFLSRIQRVLSRNLKVNPAPFLEQLFGFSFTFYNDTRSITAALQHQKFQPDLVITLSKGGSFRPHYSVLQFPELHDKWMAYVHDPYPAHYYPRPYNWVESSHKAREAFFRAVSTKARYSAFPSLLLHEWMSSYFPNFAQTGVVIPHQNAKYVVQDTSFPSYFDVSKFNVLHAGNLMKQRSPEGLIAGFQLFLQHYPEAEKESRLLLLGPASDHAQLFEKHQKKTPELYIHNGMIPFDTVYLLQQSVSVNVILESKAEISPFLPAKFPHCVAASKPILALAPYYSETKRLLGNDYAYWAEVDDVPRIAVLVGELYCLWKQNPKQLLLNRSDLAEYLSVSYLKKTIDNLEKNN
ncbi:MULTISPECIES: UDP-glycosyltransferase [unclassified Flavobacterium]|uniref:UDP-glycosyltransferase n=1 Tax=unclassified Flavobacterium TaxID=196869 RepID=UPI001F239ADA|nr:MULTISPECIES: UDP-glycosyltransferase [unclassified Flavobacterium]